MDARVAQLHVRQQLTPVDGAAVLFHTAVMDGRKWARVALFLVAVFAADWALALWALDAGVVWGTRRGVALGTIYMLVPGLVSVAFCLARGLPVVATLGLKPEFNAVLPLAFVFGVALPLMATCMSFFMPGASYAPDASGVIEKAAATMSPEEAARLREQLTAVPPIVMYLFGLLQAVMAGCTVNAVIAMGEEAAWRGWLHQELASLGPWHKAWFIGAFWGLWHLPLVLQGHNYPEHPVEGVAMMVVFAMLLAPPLGWLREHAKSTWAPALAHGLINGAAGLAVLFVKGGSDLLVGVPGLAGMFVLIGINVLVWRYGAAAIARR